MATTTPLLVTRAIPVIRGTKRWWRIFGDDSGVPHILTPPVLILSPMIQQLGVGDALSFPGSELALFALSSVVYVYGGWPFLTGFTSELREGMPGMMTQIALAISVAYVYSATVTFDIPGMSFYWELVTLIVIMLLGHWLEMRSVMGASRALEELVRLLPDTASRIDSAGSVHEVAISALRLGDHVLIRLGSKVPVDGTILAGKSSFNQVKPTGDLPTPFQGTGRWRHRWRDQRRERGHHRSHGNR